MQLNLLAVDDFLRSSVNINSNAEYTRFNQSGGWTMGQDQDEIENSEKFVVNLTSIRAGYISWDNDKPEPEMVLLTEPQVNINNLNQAKTWDKALSFEARSLSDGTEILVSFSTVGGVKAIAELIQGVAKDPRVDSGHFPVITLSGDSYFNKKFSKQIYFPVFNIVGWEKVQA